MHLKHRISLNQTAITRSHQKQRISILKKKIASWYVEEQETVGEEKTH